MPLQLHLQRAKTAGTETVSEKTFYIVDEASVASTKQMEAFLRTVQSQDHVLFIGDDDPNPRKVGQHTSVEAGRIFQGLQEAGMKTAHFNRVYRQKDPELKAAVTQFRYGNTEQGFELLKAQNRVREYASKQDRYLAIAEAFTQEPKGTIVISPDNKSRQELNAVVRAQMRTAGHLEGEDRLTRILAARDVAVADQALAVSYRPGDELKFNRASKNLGVARDSYATVESVDTERNEITIRTDKGKVLTYEPQQAEVVSVFEERIEPMAAGDRVQFTAKSKKLSVSTRDTGTIKSLDQHGNIKISLDRSGRTVQFNVRDHQHIDYCYAMTSHSIQGKTVKRDLWNVETNDPRLGKLLNQTAAYVGVSRPEYELVVFADDVKRLLPTLSRKNEASKALTPEEIKAYRQSLERETSEELAPLVDIGLEVAH